MANELRFHLNLTTQQALRYYQGHARAVVVRTDTGQRLQFPVEHIRPFIDEDGVHGYFRIRFDDNNKLIGIDKIA